MESFLNTINLLSDTFTDPNDVASTINMELDLYLAEYYDITLDELDFIPIDKIHELRIYALFGNEDLLDEEMLDLEIWLEENYPYKEK